MKFENTHVMNFEGAIRGMRNPKASWAKSDSYFGIIDDDYDDSALDDIVYNWVTAKNLKKDQIDGLYDWLIDNGTLYRCDNCREVAYIGPNDMKLVQSLIQGGPEHRKFLRQIIVSVDITAPIFWWKEADTYKVGTVANSTSTMHKLASTPIDINCFEIDDYDRFLSFDLLHNDGSKSFSDVSDNVLAFINFLESLRQAYNETKDSRYWKELVRWLPESWLQTRTWTCNYENLLSICHQREGHKLSEWHQFIEWVKTLPYADALIFYNNNQKQG